MEPLPNCNRRFAGVILMLIELTVCGTSKGHLIITDPCLVEIERPPGTTVTRSKVLAMVFGGALGAALMSTDDEETGLRLGGSLLNLERGEAIPDNIELIDRVVTCWGTEVPEQLMQQRTWPRRLADDAQLTFFPRHLVRSVRLSWTGELFADVDGSKDVDVGISFWQVGKARRHLQRAEYPL